MKIEDCLNKPVLCTDGRVRELHAIEPETLWVRYPMDGEVWSAPYAIHRSVVEGFITNGTIIE